MPHFYSLLAKAGDSIHYVRAFGHSSSHFLICGGKKLIASIGSKEGTRLKRGYTDSEPIVACDIASS